MPRYDEGHFRGQVDRALTTLKQALHTTRHPTYAEDTDHTYDDKFGLVEFLTNVSLAAQFACLESIGLDAPKLAQLQAWAHAGKQCTLRLTATERCTFLREVSRDVESASKVVHDSKLFGKSETKVVTRIDEFFWKFEVAWELTVFAGAATDGTDRVRLHGRSGSCEIMSSTRQPPRAETVNKAPLDTSLTWPLQQLSAPPATLLAFKVDREAEGCATPRRNAQVEAALASGASLSRWCERVDHYFRVEVFPVFRPTSVSGADGGRGHGLELDEASLDKGELFVPVLPLFEARGVEVGAEQAAIEGEAAAEGDGEQGKAEARQGLVAVAEAGGGASPVLRLGDISLLLRLQAQQMAAKWGELRETFPPGEGPLGTALISAEEAVLCGVVQHLGEVCGQYAQGVGHLEEMLRRQLVAALGKEVTPADFDKYMVYHDQRRYRPEFAPEPFCFAVRRPDHYPEGVVSLEATPVTNHSAYTGLPGAGAVVQPIYTTCRRVAEPAPLSFKINAATRVQFTGERFVHAYVGHAFAGASGVALSLTARARQFSCFMVLLGRMGPGGTFEPSHAIVLQNKDELTVPLALSQLPTAREFRDAIESLSPEQQRFAKAYRAMQLEGCVLGVLVLQLKPQLERLLKLGDGALTKEIKLTQQLLQLFVEHQIPSDLLSYGGGDAAAPEALKLEAVRGHVAAIMAMVEEAKQAELHQRRQEACYDNPLAGGRGGSSEGYDDDDEPPAIEVMCYQQSSCARSMAAEPRGKKGGGVMGMSRPRSGGPPPPPMAMMSAAPPPPPMRAMMANCAHASMAAPPQQAVMMYAATSYPSQPQSSATPAPASASAPALVAMPQPQPPSAFDGESVVDAAEAEEMDYTQLPAVLDAKLLSLDKDSAVRPTRIDVGKVWTRRAQRALLAKPTSSTLGTDEQKQEKEKAFDLLDALSRSGDMPFDCAALHVILAVTHCFDASLMDTVVVKNVNPIEKLEHSSLLLATTIHDLPAERLLRSDVLA